MRTIYIDARQPVEVAAEVERERARGCDHFILRAVAHGGMVDQERLGAARYAAGLHVNVELESLSEAAARR